LSFPIFIYQRGGWRKVHNQELHNLSSSPYDRVIKSGWMNSMCYEAHMGEVRNAYNFSWRTWRGETTWGDL